MKVDLRAIVSAKKTVAKKAEKSVACSVPQRGNSMVENLVDKMEQEKADETEFQSV